MRKLGPWFLMAAVGMACQAAPPIAHPKASAKAEATVAAAASATPRPAASATTASFLAKPAGDSTAFTGHLRLDASYMVGQHAASLLPTGAVAVTGSEFLSHNAGSIVAQGGGNLVASTDAHFLSHNGSAIVAQGAGNFLSHNAGGIVAQGGGNYRLQDAAGSGAATPTAGTEVPAAGMQVVVYSLATGEPLALGVDGAGKPVYSVYTDAQGSYQVYLPASERGNVMVEAFNPTSQDAHMTYDTVASVAAGDVTVDEDSATVTRYVVLSMAARMEDIMTQPLDKTIQLIEHQWSVDDAVRCVVETQIKALHAEGETWGMVGDGFSAKRHELCYRGALAAISKLDFHQIPADVDEPQGKDVMTALTEKVTKYRLRATALMNENPRYFDNADFMKIANLCDAGRYSISKPSDMMELWLHEYFGVMDTNAFNYLEKAMSDLYTPAPGATPYRTTDAHGMAYETTAPDVLADEHVFVNASESLLFRLMSDMADPAGQTSKDVTAAMTQPLPSLDPNASPVPSPCWLDGAESPIPDPSTAVCQ